MPLRNSKSLVTGMTKSETKQLFESNNYILEFNGLYRFLSNFYLAVVTYDGITYPSSEHAFVAQKTLDVIKRHELVDMMLTPGEAKKYGKKLKLRSDWEAVKYDIMKGIVKAKFTQNPALLEKLLDTGDKILVEGNTWGDTIWGVYLGTLCGKNYLGMILMEVRAECNAKH